MANGCPSPEATTSAILGASSAGWSPVRAAKRPVLGDAAVQRESYTGSDAGGSPGKSTPHVPTHRQNIAVLRSHGLVSNSIFKSGNLSPTHSQASPQQASPTRHSPFQERQRSPDAKMGVGLGISASMNSPTKANSTARSMSNSSIGSAQSTSDAENEEGNTVRAMRSRKSQGFRKLEQASYVSKSPFRKQGAGSEDEQRPLSLPDNAWAASAKSNTTPLQQHSPTRERPERVGGVPRTPERTPQRLATAFGSGEPDFGTPTSLGTPRSSRAPNVDSPSSRGLLVSNRLHGPRLMEGNLVSASPQDSPTKRERRKTVTFDEVLDVQEFDRESSFDGHSLQSASSQASSLNGISGTGSPATDEEMWLNGSANKVVEKLMVVNGSPNSESSAFSTPELDNRKTIERGHQRQGSDLVDSSSTDSRELSSIDEPRSPPPGEVSFEQEHDKSYNTAPDASYFNESVYVNQDSDLSGGNLSAYGALHRVDSLVDELLEGDLLGKGRTAQESKPSVSDSPPRRRRGAGLTLGEQEKIKPLPNVPDRHEVQQGQVQLSLPAWSPLMRMEGAKDDQEVEAELQTATAAAPTSQATRPKTAGRPHISRDAVLQRVAREKRLQEEQNQKQQSQDGRSIPETREEGSVPHARSHNALPMRRSEGAGLVSRSVSGAIIPAKVDVQPESARPLSSVASPAKAPQVTQQVTADDLESPLERLSAEVAFEQEQATRTNIAIRQKGRESSDSESTRRQQAWFSSNDEPEARLQVQGQNANASGRLSPSMVGGDLPKLTPDQQAEQIIARRRSKNGKGSTSRPRGRRSLSEGAEGLEVVDIKSSERPSGERINTAFSDETNEAELREEELLRNRHMLDASLKGAIDNGFETGLEREISRIYRQGEQKYKINDRGAFSSAEDKVAHSSKAGDVDSGKAWRKLRRPSDMNEYAKEMRDYRENENPRKAAGKVFVLVDSFTPSSLPVPSKPTRFYCVLDNGLHVVKTATAPLRPGNTTASKIGQEFELIQHKNLEFSLTMIVQRDAHLREAPEESPASRKMTPSFSRGMGKLFSSPKKKAAFATSSTNSSMAGAGMAGPTVEPILSYINQEGAFGRVDVVFEQVAQQCLAKCLVLDLPVRGVNDPAPSLSASSMQGRASIDFSKNLGRVRGTLRLKLFYLPPMPSVPRALMPQNLGDCIRGMEAARWHSGEAWMEGTLTQLGGDCQSWRRRPVRAQGAHLVGYNEITKKPTVKIDLTKAVAIEQSHDPVNQTEGTYAMDDEELDETYHVERSFRITFKDGERIYFFADTDDEMKRWMAALKKVVGNTEIPKNCVWASVAQEMIRQAKEKSELAKSTSAVAGTASGSNASKRVPVKKDDLPRNQLDAPSRPSGMSTPASQQQQRLVSASTETPSHYKSRLQAQTPLSAVRESPTPEETPTRRRPVSTQISQKPHQASKGRMNVERPVSVYVDGRS